jgi:hypothetical protein
MPKSTGTKMGWPLRYGDKEPMQSVQIRLSIDMISWIEKIARKRGVPRSEVIRAAIEGGKGEVEKP